MRALLLAVTLAFAAPAPRTALEDARLARESFMLGNAAYEQGRLEDAIKFFGEASRLSPGWSLAFLQLGVALLATNEKGTDAVTALEQATRLDNKNPRARLQLGIAYEATRRYDEAARELRAALSLRPDLKDARFHLASVLAVIGPSSEAIELYLRVIESEPQNSAALTALAELYEQLGQHGNAESALLAIVRLYPNVPYHRYRLAEFYQRIGDTKKAKATFAELEQREPPKRKMRDLR